MTAFRAVFVQLTRDMRASRHTSLSLPHNMVLTQNQTPVLVESVRWISEVAVKYETTGAVGTLVSFS